MATNPFDWDALREYRRSQLTPEEQVRFDECSHFPSLAELGVSQFREALSGYDTGEVRGSKMEDTLRCPAKTTPSYGST